VGDAIEMLHRSIFMLTGFLDSFPTNEFDKTEKMLLCSNCGFCLPDPVLDGGEVALPHAAIAAPATAACGWGRWFSVAEALGG
jgi:hypothetical protein